MQIVEKRVSINTENVFWIILSIFGVLKLVSFKL